MLGCIALSFCLLNILSGLKLLLHGNSAYTTGISNNMALTCVPLQDAPCVNYIQHNFPMKTSDDPLANIHYRKPNETKQNKIKHKTKQDITTHFSEMVPFIPPPEGDLPKMACHPPTQNCL